MRFYIKISVGIKLIVRKIDRLTYTSRGFCEDFAVCIIVLNIYMFGRRYVIIFEIRIELWRNI